MNLKKSFYDLEIEHLESYQNIYRYFGRAERSGSQEDYNGLVKAMTNFRRVVPKETRSRLLPRLSEVKLFCIENSIPLNALRD